MALSSDFRQQVFLDSSRRIRKDFPLSSEFVSVIGKTQTGITDPVAEAFPLFVDVVGAGGYIPVPSGGAPGRVQLTTGITTNLFENEFLDQIIEIVDLTGLTPISRGFSKVAGFAALLAPPGVFANWLYLQTDIIGVVPGDTVIIRQLGLKPEFRYISGAVAAPTTTITFPASASIKDDNYKGQFLHVYGDDTEYTITSYNGTTKIATFYPALVSAIISALVEVYRVRENAPGLSGNGSMESRTSQSNHEIKLEWIRIPRQPLFVHNVLDPSIVKTVNDLNFLTVQFRNTSDSSGQLIQSNSPLLAKAQFVVPVEELSTTVGKFFTLRCPVTITTKYNPQEPIHFGVYMPNGSPVRFDSDDDNTGTIAPNPDLQITALFSIKRVIH
jgi:hypothetical protein